MGYQLNGHSDGTDAIVSTEAQVSLNGHNESPEARAQQIAALQQREMKIVRLEVKRACHRGNR